MLLVPARGPLVFSAAGESGACREALLGPLCVMGVVGFSPGTPLLLLGGWEL